MLTHQDINILFFKIITEDDHEAFKTLFYQFFSPLCMFAHRYVDDWEICQDIVQDVFTKVWDKRQTLKIDVSPRNFMITCVKNNCIDIIRKQEQHASWIQTKTVIVEEVEYDSDVYSMTELREMLEKALSNLPDNVRKTFEMNRFEKKKYSEIAQEMGVSVKTVESHISKALKLLREELKDYLPIIIIMLEIIKK